MKFSILLISFLSFVCSCNDNINKPDTKAGLNFNDTIHEVKNNISEREKSKVDSIDPVKVSPDKFKILMENEYTRIVEYTLKPGEKDNWHTHPPKTSYIISGGRLRITLGNGESFIVDEKTGSASWMGAIGKHFAENIGNTTVTILLTEIKSLK